MNTDPTNDLPVEVSEYLPALREPQASPPTTSAQAKIDAVASLTLSAYQKAGQLQLSPEETERLQANFPDEAFRSGASGKEDLIYIEHANLRERLNQVVGPGQWAIVPRSRWAEDYEYYNSTKRTTEQATRVYVEAMLIIRGCFAAEAIGDMTYYKANQSTNYGDAVEGAKSAALRRCAKELGIGLQAWKKDWCEGWWQRKRNAMRPQNAPPAPGVPVSSPPKPKTASPPPQAAKTPPVASQAPPTPKRTPAGEKEHIARLETWLEQCKTQLLSKLEPVLGGVKEYAIAKGMIMPNELPVHISLNKLFPSVVWSWSVDQNKAGVKKDFDALTAAVQSWMDGDALPDEDVDQIPGAEVPDGQGPASAEPPADEWFWDLIVPVPRKGQKRDEYLKHPDTIRSLYEQRHGTDEDAQLARERLYGFVHHYQPKGWVKKDGTQMPASEADKKFRDALDAFWEVHEKTGEKL